jgi:PncC family amidohydrolase
VIAYDNRLKTELLGVPAALLQEKGAVSAEVAEAMAVGCRTRLGTDLAVSTVGVAGPGDLGPELPAGLLYVGLAWEGGSSTTRLSWPGTRADVQRRAAKTALNRVRLHLLASAPALPPGSRAS